MFQIGSVSLLLLLLLSLIINSLSLNNDNYLNYLGVKQTPYGLGHQFSNLIKLKINFSMDINPIEIPEKLDCMKYVVESSTRNGRRKRDVSGSASLVVDNLPVCAYNFDPLDPSIVLESEQEEMEWQKK